MKWYIQAFRNTFDFKGRARRSEFWYFWLFNTLIILGMALIANIIAEILDNNHQIIDKIFLPIFSIYLLISIIPSLSLMVRRLHDTGQSGKYILLGLIPYIGVIILLIFALLNSESGNNQWGENPKEAKVEDIMDHLVDNFE